jgi:hypothetical protein
MRLDRDISGTGSGRLIQARQHTTFAALRTDETNTRTSRRRGAIILYSVAIVGLAARAGLVYLAPDYAYLNDHVDFMVWSEWARRDGPATLYHLPGRTLVNTRLPRYMSQGGEITPYPAFNAYNYPPLAGYLMWLQGWAWSSTGPEVETRTVRPAIARLAGIPGGHLTSPVVNTVATRAINAALPAIADYLMAWGILRLVRRLRGHTGWADLAGFGLVVLGPPFILDSAFWTQLDAVPACLLVWALYFLSAERCLAAGVCFGAALMIKAQALLFVPTLGFIFLGLWMSRGWRQALRLWRMVAAAVVVVLVAAIPAALADRGEPQGGSLRWIDRAYVYPITKQFPLTSLKAFNVWWLDYLSHGQSVAALRADSLVLGGLTRDRVGQVLALAALLAAAAVCARRWRWERAGWPAFTFLALLALFTFPTRVHERYIYFCLPFLVLAAVTYRPWWPVVAGLFVVGSFEMTWCLWLANPTVGDAAPAQSGDAALISLVLSFVTVASFAYALVIAWPLRSRSGAKPARCS